MKSDNSTPGNQQNQAFSQVILPFLFFLILVIIAGILLFSRISSGTSDIRAWADISVVLIVLPLLLAFIVFLVVIIISITLTIGLQKRIVLLIKKIDTLSFTFKSGITKAAQSLVKPLILINSRLSILKRIK